MSGWVVIPSLQGKWLRPGIAPALHLKSWGGSGVSIPGIVKKKGSQLVDGVKAIAGATGE